VPATHEIDETNKLIITDWNGEASDHEFLDTLTRYQHEIRGNPDYQSFNELLDFRHISKVNLTTDGLIELSRIARKTDRKDIPSRLAVLVSSSLAFGLARMYITYRNLEPGSHKTLKVFKNRADALAWLIESPAPLNS